MKHYHFLWEKIQTRSAKLDTSGQRSQKPTKITQEILAGCRNRKSSFNISSSWWKGNWAEKWLEWKTGIFPREKHRTVLDQTRQRVHFLWARCQGIMVLFILCTFSVFAFSIHQNLYARKFYRSIDDFCKLWCQNVICILFAKLSE